MQLEKCLLFVKSYLERCKADSSTHEVVFILYARLYYPQVSCKAELLTLARQVTGNRDLTI